MIDTAKSKLVQQVLNGLESEHTQEGYKTNLDRYVNEFLSGNARATRKGQWKSAIIA